MWDNRQDLLSQGLNLQMFLRDAKQAEVMLSQQENYLAKEDLPSSLEQAEHILKRHQDFITTMDANDEKIKAVGMFGDQLCQDGHYAADKVRLFLCFCLSQFIAPLTISDFSHFKSEYVCFRKISCIITH